MKFEKLKNFVASNGLVKWTKIERVGNSKIAKQSYFWFFVLPVLAKLLQKVNGEIHLDFISKEFVINMELPFKWYAFFVIGLLLILSNLLYQITCPHIVKEFRNYSQFLESGYPNSYLIEQGKENKIDKKETEELLRFHRQVLDHPEYHDYYSERLREKQSEYFDKVYITANTSGIFYRSIGTILLVLVAVLTLYLFYANIQAVYHLVN